MASEYEDYDKRAKLRELIEGAVDLKNGIIFCNRKKDVATVFRSLDRHGYSCGALHGDMDQTSRTATLNGFRDNKISLLVASDVAARGLDIPDVSHVFNFDVPVNAEDYVHRIGRTGRAGRKGVAYMIVVPTEQKGFDAIESLIGQKIDWLDGNAVEWDAKAGRRGRGKPAHKKADNRPAKTAPKPQPAEPVHEKPAERSDAPKQNVKRGRKPFHEQTDVEYSDTDHAFGGDEHIPAFLR